ncbi:hypothetical protein FKP32DRAFT_210234 [Trametes sanguinea]|nr:hypothetical protein FKP32DRAFT_210234 [Trametes sanguinea]
MMAMRMSLVVRLQVPMSSWTVPPRVSPSEFVSACVSVIVSVSMPCLHSPSASRAYPSSSSSSSSDCCLSFVARCPSFGSPAHAHRIHNPIHPCSPVLLIAVRPPHPTQRSHPSPGPGPAHVSRPMSCACAHPISPSALCVPRLLQLRSCDRSPRYLLPPFFHFGDRASSLTVRHIEPPFANLVLVMARSGSCVAHCLFLAIFPAFRAAHSVLPVRLAPHRRVIHLHSSRSLAPESAPRSSSTTACDGRASCPWLSLLPVRGRSIDVYYHPVPKTKQTTLGSPLLSRTPTQPDPRDRSRLLECGLYVDDERTVLSKLPLWGGVAERLRGAGCVQYSCTIGTALPRRCARGPAANVLYHPCAAERCTQPSKLLPVKEEASSIVPRTFT